MSFVFDFANVLFGWQPTAVVRQALPQQAADEASAAHWAREIFQAYGGDWADFDRGTVEPDALVERIAARTGLPPEAVRRVVDAVPIALQPIAGTVDLLERLHALGDPVYFLSNMPAPYADHLDRSHAFLRCFADGVYSGRVQLIKPEPAIFELAARRFGVPPADLVFLDDHLPNVEAARAAGWQALHFIDAAQCEAELHQRGLWPQALPSTAPARRTPPG
ncbi:HAD family phosphatase [Ideonella sp. A 288]|uniref:HAD family hydrolase n=1 Tax=Ideonella sp. A 288 TaxID=1962181 RepID=UPI000B4A77CA|nr:HAD family phosphatase [Ideonella sp. A 288]